MRLRSILFQAGDLVFLAVVGAVTTWAMHLVHETGWTFVLCALLGMVAAMLVQMLLACCVAPVLGSIEAAVPSMVVAMVGPMSVCIMHLLGFEPGQALSLALGAFFGVAVFVFVQAYAAVCRKFLEHSFGNR